MNCCVLFVCQSGELGKGIFAKLHTETIDAAIVSTPSAAAAVRVRYVEGLWKEMLLEGL